MSEETLSAIDRLFDCGCYEDDPEMGICKHTSIKLESLHRAASAGSRLKQRLETIRHDARGMDAPFSGSWLEEEIDAELTAYDLATSPNGDPSGNSSDDGGEVW